MTLQIQSTALSGASASWQPPSPNATVEPDGPVPRESIENAGVPARAHGEDFSCPPEKPLRPADTLPSRVANTLLGIYRAKHGIDVGAADFRDSKAKAAELRAWCDSLPPGGCGWALASTASGVHVFALAVCRGADGVARCLVADSMGLCLRRVVADLQQAFDGRLYLTPQIQRTHQLGCVVFAMRFLLMTRAPGMGERVLESLAAFERQHQDTMPALRQLDLGDCGQLGGWLAGAQLRPDILRQDSLLARTLDNGGRHAGWTVAKFFDERPYTLTQDVRQMYREVDVLVNDPARSLVSPERRAYLQKRFLRHLAPRPTPADA